MKKLILNDDTIKSLDTLYQIAMDFVGYPQVIPHLNKIKEFVVDEPDEEKKEE